MLLLLSLGTQSIQNIRQAQIADWYNRGCVRKLMRGGVCSVSPKHTQSESHVRASELISEQTPYVSFKAWLPGTFVWVYS